MPRKMQVSKNVVKWLSEEIIDENRLSTFFKSYEKFQFNNIVAGIGDFVLVSNADAAEPDTEGGCDAARIISLYEDLSSQSDQCRAKVQWYSRPGDIPKGCFYNIDGVNFLENEVVEDHRPFDSDVSIETFFKKCQITFTLTKDIDHFKNAPYHYICRYRLIPLTKKKFGIEPVLEQERKAMELLGTPNKNISSPKPRTPKTPSSLIAPLNRISLSEQRNWSVSKNDGTKLLLKRAILTDKLEKNSPKKVNDSCNNTPHNTNGKKLSKTNIEDMLDMELQENSDDELPTLIIRQPSNKTEEKKTPSRKSISNISKNSTPNKKVEFVPLKLKVSSGDELPTLVIREKLTSPKRKQSLSRANDETPKKVLVFEANDKPPTRIRRSTVTDTKTETPSRSRRSTRTAVSYVEPESPVKSTPKKTMRKMDDSDDDDFAPIPSTPKTPRTPRTVHAKTPRTPATPKTPRSTRTPKSVTRRILTSQLTPSLHSRAHSVENINEYLKENGSLPGREDQMAEILSFVRNKLLGKTSGCMYISGVPGTGKTATVCSALNILKEEADLPEFQLVEVNGMRISEPRQAYVQIYKQLTGKSVVWEQACTLLEKRFTNPGPRRTPTVLLVDELDALCTRRQDVLYSIMEWTTHNSALLTVLAVANTMDLPERALASRVASRLGLTRLTFPPYTHTQLQTIVCTRLVNANVTSDAVQLIARKVAAVSGDARRALALCSRALELAGPGGAGLKEVQQALAEAASSAAVRSIKNCSQAERLLLRAIAAEVERTGTDETTLSRALHTAAAIVALDGRPYRSAPHVRAPTPAQALAICARLAACRLVLLEYKAEPRLLLNVSTDDVHYATKEICV